MFVRNKVKINRQMGSQYSCVCGEWNPLAAPYYDGDIPGYEPDQLTRCWECGRVFTFPEGKFVTQTYTGEARVTLDDYLDAHPEIRAKNQAKIDAHREGNPEWHAMSADQQMADVVLQGLQANGVDVDEFQRVVQKEKSLEERRAQYLHSQNQARAEIEQSLEGQSTDPSTLLNQVISKVNRLRITSIVLSFAAMFPFFLVFMSAIELEDALPFAWVSVGLTIASAVVLVIAERTKRRLLGRPLRLRVPPTATGMSLGLAAFFGLFWGLVQIANVLSGA